MNLECKAAYDKANKLIQANINKFGANLIPEVHPFDFGNIHIQYFLGWDDLLGTTRIRKFNNLNDDKLKDVKLIFSREGNILESKKYDCDKTYMILNGEMLFNLNNDEVKRVETYESFEIGKGIPHSIITIRDTYVVIVESYN